MKTKEEIEVMIDIHINSIADIAESDKGIEEKQTLVTLCLERIQALEWVLNIND